MRLANLSFLMGGGMTPDLLCLTNLGRRSHRLANMVLDWPNRHVDLLSDFSQSGCVLVALFIPHLVYGQLVEACTEETLSLEGAHEFPLALPNDHGGVDVPWSELVILEIHPVAP